LICLALATGMKCLPAAKLAQSNGVAIHDWHAEVLAIRTFNRFLLDECRNNLENAGEFGLLERTNPSSGAGSPNEPFQISGDVKLHMYCSEAPCGDASMELTMAAQEDASPWEVPSPAAAESVSGTESNLPGRAYFSQLGVVRRKPARGDAPPTLSKSCSDKLALKQCTSLLSSLTSLFINPANVYVDTLVLPRSQYSPTACERAFSAQGRMKALNGRQWSGGYSFNPLRVEVTDIEFEYSKVSVRERTGSTAANNLAAVWCHSGFEENIVGGVLQGKKAFDERGASRMSRRRMWSAAKDLASQVVDSHGEIGRLLEVSTYRDIKNGSRLAVRRQVKTDARELALVGWVRNEGDADFTISHGP